MRVHVIYRTHPGGNRKRRPSWFSRAVAWASLEASLAAVDSTVTVVADGGVPAELQGRLGSADRLVTVRGGQAASSFRRALAVAVESADRGPADELFWFAEDDYLYQPDAFHHLVGAASAVPAADYLALYAPDDNAWHSVHPSQPVRTVPPVAGEPLMVGDVGWHRIAKTTSTFGVRSQVLRADRRLLDLGSRVGAPFDTATWHALQGHRPFPYRHLLSDLDPARSVRGTVKVVAKPIMRLAFDVTTAVTRPARTLIAPTTDLAVHMEHGQYADEHMWSQIAARYIDRQL